MHKNALKADVGHIALSYGMEWKAPCGYRAKRSTYAYCMYNIVSFLIHIAL